VALSAARFCPKSVIKTAAHNGINKMNQGR